MKKWLVVVLGVCLMLSLSSCRRRDLPVSGGTENNTASGAQALVQIWMAGSEDEKAFLEAMGREFLVSIQDTRKAFRVINFPSKELLYETFLHKAAEGAGPDIIYAEGDWIAQNTGKLIPREDETFQVGPYRQTFVRSAHETLIQDEQMYGIPLGVDTLAVYYNRNHTQDRLLERNKPAENWEDFQRDAELLTKTDNSIQRFSASGVALGRADNIFYAFEILENLMLQQNVPFFNPEGTQAKFHVTTGLDPKTGRQINLGEDSINFYTSFADPRYKHYSWGEFLASENDGLKNFDAFVGGKTSMIFGYLRDYDYLEDITEIRSSQGKYAISETSIGVSPFPQSPLSKDRKLVGKVYGLAVPKSSKYPELSWSYLKFVMQKENLQSFLDEVDVGPSRVDLITPFLDDPIKGVFAQQAKFARSNLSRIDKSQLKVWFEDLIQAANDQKGTVRTLLAELGQKANNLLRARNIIEQQINPPSLQSTRPK